MRRTAEATTSRRRQSVRENGELQPEEQGLPRSITGQARIIGFNDVDALEAALAQRDVAVVLAEPAMTNAGFILLVAGFHDALRRLTREAGTLLAINETHSLVTAYGGLTRAYGLEPDMLTIGKSIAAVTSDAAVIPESGDSTVRETPSPRIKSSCLNSSLSASGAE